MKHIFGLDMGLIRSNVDTALFQSSPDGWYANGKLGLRAGSGLMLTPSDPDKTFTYSTVANAKTLTVTITGMTFDPVPSQIPDYVQAVLTRVADGTQSTRNIPVGSYPSTISFTLAPDVLYKLAFVRGGLVATNGEEITLQADETRSYALTFGSNQALIYKTTASNQDEAGIITYDDANRTSINIAIFIDGERKVDINRGNPRRLLTSSSDTELGSAEFVIPGDGKQHIIEIRDLDNKYGYGWSKGVKFAKYSGTEMSAGVNGDTPVSLYLPHRIAEIVNFNPEGYYLSETDAGNYTFTSNFCRMTSLQSIPDITVRAGIVSAGIFMFGWAFAGCTSLITAPKITVQDANFKLTNPEGGARMFVGAFNGCTGLPSDFTRGFLPIVAKPFDSAEFGTGTWANTLYVNGDGTRPRFQPTAEQTLGDECMVGW